MSVRGGTKEVVNNETSARRAKGSQVVRSPSPSATSRRTNTTCRIEPHVILYYEYFMFQRNIVNKYSGLFFENNHQLGCLLNLKKKVSRC